MIRRFLPITIALLFVAGIYFTNVVTSDDLTSDSIEIPEDPAIKAAFENYSVYDSLPYYRYKQITDSIRFVVQASDPFHYGNTTSVGSIGIYESSKDAPTPTYALTLSNVEKDREAKYYIYNRTPHIAWVKWDSTRVRNDGKSRYGHYESSPIKVGYDKEDKRLFVPVSKTTYTIVTILMWTGLFVSLVAFLTVFISYPITIFRSIARGDGFNETNGILFKRMGYVLAAFAVLGFLIPVIISLVFRHMIPSQFYLPVWDSFTSIIPALILAVALWLLGKAFTQGSQLQEFENTTV
jgi:hypothetical protein